MINSKNTLMYVFISKNPSNYTWCCIKCNSTFFICLLWQTQDLGVGKFFLLFYWRKELSYVINFILLTYIISLICALHTFFFWQKLSLPTIFRTVAELMLMLSFSLSIWIRDNQTPWLQICFFKNKCKKWERKEKKKKKKSSMISAQQHFCVELQGQNWSLIRKQSNVLPIISTRNQLKKRDWRTEEWRLLWGI